jgi:hypothetical protein
MTIVSDIVSGLAKPVTDLISEFITDKDKAAQLAFDISTLAATQAHAQVLAQLAVNQAEASSGSMFVGGWRPAVGWVCVLAMALNFILTPMLGPVVEAYTPIVMAPLEMGEMMPILLGMLGLTAARTYEKRQGVAKP